MTMKFLTSLGTEDYHASLADLCLKISLFLRIYKNYA